MMAAVFTPSLSLPARHPVLQALEDHIQHRDNQHAQPDTAQHTAGRDDTWG